MVISPALEATGRNAQSQLYSCNSGQAVDIRVRESCLNKHTFGKRTEYLELSGAAVPPSEAVDLSSD